MNKIKRLIMVLVTITFISGSLFANGQKESKNANKSGLERVTLKFIFPGIKKDLTDEVWDTIAEEFREELNADFEIIFIPFADYAQKMTVLAASGDDWDMNFNGEWLAYNQMINTGAYLDITELLPKYAPKLYEIYQAQGTLSAATVKGKIVALPWTMNMNQRSFFSFRTDLTEAAGYNFDASEIKTLEDVDAVLKALHKAYPNKKIIEKVFKEVLFAKYELSEVGFNLVYSLNDPDIKIMPYEETQAYADFVYWANKWQQDGYISKDSLVNFEFDKNREIFEGLMITMFESHEWANAYKPFVEDSARQASAFLYPDNKYANRSPLANLVAINANAENPERTLMFMNLLETNKKLYDMVQYGIEGVTYILGDDGTANYPENMTSQNSNYMEWTGQWGLWKPQFMRPNPSYGPEFWDEEAKFAALPVNINSPLSGFFPDPSNIENKLARREQIWTEYDKVFSFGLYDDPNLRLSEMREKMKTADSAAIVKDIQSQIDAFIGK